MSYLPWKNKYPNVKTTCYINPKFSLRTKLPKSLLPPKYVMSVAAALSENHSNNLWISPSQDEILNGFPEIKSAWIMLILHHKTFSTEVHRCLRLIHSVIVCTFMNRNFSLKQQSSYLTLGKAFWRILLNSWEPDISNIWKK